MQKILVIQTAFIGDAVLATGLLEKLHECYPGAETDILVRKGNESLFASHPFLHAVLIWDKKGSKYRNLWKILKQIRSRKYDLLVNVQRFAATGIVTAFSGAKHTIGFDKNPFSFLFTEAIRHVVSEDGKIVHETDRNHELIRSLTGDTPAKPRLYPGDADTKRVAPFQNTPYICIAPASVWFTKQFPADQWTQFINALPQHISIYLLGGAGDHQVCEGIKTAATHPLVTNLAGELNFLASAALQQKAVMNYVNDSAPMHFASAVNAPVTAVYCSTIPAFGFGPLSDNSHIVEIQEPLACRPCGLHGRKVCPLGHFNCAKKILTSQLLNSL
jgi:heptosyltransferase-2